MRMSSRHLRQNGSKVGRAKGQRCGDPEPPAKLARRQDRLAGCIDLRRDSRRVMAKRRAFFRQCDAARRARDKLYAKFRLEPSDAPTDHRFGDAKPLRRGRDTSGISNFHKGFKIVDFHQRSPFCDTACVFQGYRMRDGNDRFLLIAVRWTRSDVSTFHQQGFFMTFRNGLASLLRPEDSVLVLIDHQPYQLANVNSHEPTMVVNNTVGLAKAAKAFDVPTILTTVIAERGGRLFPQIADVFPHQDIIDRTLINTWQDPKVVNAVKATGRKQLIIAGLWTEVCVAMPAIQAAGEGWDVTVITDASGAVSSEAHHVAIQRMIAAGVNLMTWLALAAEWQRDWARADQAAKITDVIVQHSGGSGIAYLWEQQLLNTPAPKDGAGV